jgi:hypothetical protein
MGKEMDGWMDEYWGGGLRIHLKLRRRSRRERRS